MRTIIWRVSLILLLVSAGLLGGIVRPANAATTITDVGAPISNPVTDGQHVSWFDSQNNLHVMTIQNGGLTNQRIFPVKGNPVTNSLRADSGYAVWYNEEQGSNSGFYVYAINLVTGQQSFVDTGLYPAISGHQVAYLTASFSTIAVRDISTMSQSITLTQQANVNNNAVAFIVFDNNRLVWSTYYSAGHELYGYNVYTMQIGDKTPTLFKQGYGEPRSTDVDFHNGILVFSLGPEGPRMLVYNVQTGQQIPFTNTVNGEEHPTTDGRYIFYDGSWTYPETHVINLRGYDTQTNSYFDVAINRGVNVFATIRNGYLVWGQATSQMTNEYTLDSVQFSSITDTLPSARQPQTASTPDQNYFFQTGHTLSYGFKYFWEHGGGLPVFGFPLTQEFTELNPDNSQNYTVQYFERQRYEYHPEFKGTPYETELGRLGAADALQRNLYNRVPTAFTSAPKSSDPNCTYFPQTQHNVCGSFGAYWHTHGLEFGDVSVSFREAVALFGYPISEEFKDPDTGLMVQYFERARFEHQPQFAGTPNEVELGLLGQQVLQARGWQ